MVHILDPLVNSSCEMSVDGDRFPKIRKLKRKWKRKSFVTDGKTWSMNSRICLKGCPKKILRENIIIMRN